MSYEIEKLKRMFKILTGVVTTFVIVCIFSLRPSILFFVCLFGALIVNYSVVFFVIRLIEKNWRKDP